MNANIDDNITKWLLLKMDIKLKPNSHDKKIITEQIFQKLP